MEFRHIRLVAIGSTNLTGVGDARGLGWFGRVLAKTQHTHILVEPYVLAAPEETTEEMSHRWETEALPRFSQSTENRLVVALSEHDAAGSSSARARLNLANILDRAAQWEISTLVVGPVPVIDEETNHTISYFNDAYKDVAERREINYVDCFSNLGGHEQFRQDMTANRGLPGQAGYGLIAWLVLNRGWYRWLNIPRPGDEG